MAEERDERLVAKQSLKRNLCPTVKPPWAAGAQPALSPRAAGESLLPRSSSLSFCTDLGVCMAVSLTSHYSLCCSSSSSRSAVLPVLKYAVTEALPPSPMGSALTRGGSDLEPGKLRAASQRSHPCSPSPATKPQPHKPNTPCY